MYKEIVYLSYFIVMPIYMRLRCFQATELFLLIPSAAMAFS